MHKADFNYDTMHGQKVDFNCQLLLISSNSIVKTKFDTSTDLYYLSPKWIEISFKLTQLQTVWHHKGRK